MPEMIDVVLSFNDSSFKIFIDLEDPAALFFTQVYLATSVWPPRQKITGFIASDGQITISPLLPDANFKTLNIKRGMSLSLEQLPPGQEIEPRQISPHLVDKIGAKCLLLTQRVDAIEKIVTHHGDNAAVLEKLHKLCLSLDQDGMKVMLQIDEMQGDDTIRLARKGLVKSVNFQLDRVEKLKKAAKT
mmetsp:Transcript_76931/g.112649  ORF Transcript_76931/g.112649 Transcript_76931/m.112649 type:complete len:188 (+) Transcript_76931:83-646(+)|eukprot:CAMPEP_0179452076 /NCGR_PEP_ID=MMETSP0799-20121207/36028_1 /TAXON_ID=46947 /ORGANISM="Geminigera cryophila, Strain CCMP2564" /LENGTH=187 /DNA_ID=CAMNT_0021247769 /DNA_START=76 /DNA_END=639 /DNA_ORIENTATION=+